MTDTIKEPQTTPPVQIDLDALGQSTGAVGFAIKTLASLDQNVAVANMPTKQKRHLQMQLKQIREALNISGVFLYRVFNDFKKANEPTQQPEQQNETNEGKV